eukprot:4176501-Amphidinium_carterae.1
MSFHMLAQGLRTSAIHASSLQIYEADACCDVAEDMYADAERGQLFQSNSTRSKSSGESGAP